MRRRLRTTLIWTTTYLTNRLLFACQAQQLESDYASGALSRFVMEGMQQLEEFQQYRNDWTIHITIEREQVSREREQEEGAGRGSRGGSRGREQGVWSRGREQREGAEGGSMRGTLLHCIIVTFCLFSGTDI